MQKEFGVIAPPGSPFNPTDVVQQSVGTRHLVFLWEQGRRWVVAMERGGRGYSTPVSAFDVSADGKTAALAVAVPAMPEKLCQAATDLIGRKPG